MALKKIKEQENKTVCGGGDREKRETKIISLLSKMVGEIPEMISFLFVCAPSE